MVTILAFVVLGGGSAYATHLVVTSSDVADNSLQSVDLRDNGAVRSADVVNDTASGGGLVSADIRNGEVGSGDVRDNALRSADVLDDSLSGADLSESTFATVPDASHATNSDQLGGLAAADFQRRAVFPISEDLSSISGNDVVSRFSPSELTLRTVCFQSQAQVRFINAGQGGATLNWLFSQGGTTSTVNASGTSLNPFGQTDDGSSFIFTNRLEGQWIFANGAGVTTVNLHAFRVAGFCEFKGTAVWAPNA